MLCVHCNDRTGYREYRKLCRACFSRPHIRQLYPLRGWPDRHWDHEPTEEELERCIEEQRRCLPDWWHEPDEDGA